MEYNGLQYQLNQYYSRGYTFFFANIIKWQPIKQQPSEASTVAWKCIKYLVDGKKKKQFLCPTPDL